MNLTLDSPVTDLKGLKAQRAALLAERGITTIGHLLSYLPFRYEDRIHFTRIAELVPGQTATVQAEVESGSLVRFAGRRNAMFHLRVKDASGPLPLRFFHSSYLNGKFKPGQPLVLHGKVTMDPNRPLRMEMINPEYELLDAAGGTGVADSTEVGRIVPVYEAIGEISSRMLRRFIFAAIQEFHGEIPDPLSPELLQRYGFPSRRDALFSVHFPASDVDVNLLNEFRSPAQVRMIFEEFFLYQLGLAMRRQTEHCRAGIPMQVREEKVREALKKILPFKPTAAQKRVLAEIAADLERDTPMSRLLEGDVGSGKTIVALEAAAIIIENGYQVVLMAPTEILAVQHYLSARRIFSPSQYSVELLVSGMKPREKLDALERIASGKANFITGTHALIEDAVSFAKLGLVIIDEQHRFGVLQRKRLTEKGAAPHTLVMTATPIPRTLALTLYGDLDLSVIDEMPPGRTPVETQWRDEKSLPGVWEFVRREISSGRQAYIIYPVIEESKQELKAATAEYERLSKNVFPKLQTGLLHGRMRSEEKDEVMEQFRSGKIQILVATTVVEVGVDVRNATVMVIEHADRFGLAQLHQLRGRIGRGAHKSYCILIAPPKVTEEARARLETLVATADGFQIAEQDLKLRGPGEFFGTRQHGDVAFHLAHPLRDHKLLDLARAEAFALVESPTRAAELEKLAKFLGHEWQSKFRLASVG
ncbi:MAG TPA: ATP-dependent DNA helicase RecG [Candidatus Acidoferrales bacterium]|nr:ATP-dependent DNA helicase RecG [Candidatus Acidoferrales bacterium]